ncbi:MAG TPA: hypothetical protein VGM86_00520 [Thermoanaerobaculia bacterium]
MKKSLLLAAVLVFGLVQAASASCTVTTTCSNACSIIDYICSPRPCDLSCSAGNQVLSCTGTTCSADSNSVTCDGATTTCSTHWCTIGGSYIQCGNTVRQCTNNCPL